ncbi:hypothetical protein [Siminovitchia terrae]|uniref:Uncharacterized protein n=1 Tax=Siminovitchia terrae TaxID=1914933 RepID=A0A429X9D5_SIMTE|nr:hypothetical protein [Siminovitchia terrae]RST60058.1 hypothetical protein D5F11_008295 [Siminovitchia terrae]
MVFHSVGFKPRRITLKPPADATDFQRKFIEQSSIKSGCKYAKAHLMIYTYTHGVLSNLVHKKTFKYNTQKL